MLKRREKFKILIKFAVVNLVVPLSASQTVITEWVFVLFSQSKCAIFFLSSFGGSLPFEFSGEK